jgi:hypothetical protein
LNPYAYCVGDPVNRSDPTGHIFKANLFLGIRPRNAPHPFKAVSRLTTKDINLPDVGDLNVFSGTPHVLDKIVSNLPGDDLISFSLASKATRNLVTANTRPLIVNETADTMSRDTVYKLRSIALGDAYGHTPSQVLKWQNLKDMAAETPRSDVVSQELISRLVYIRNLGGRRQRWLAHLLRHSH